jgi:hypothetical protein
MTWMVKRSTPASVGHLPELGFGADSGAVALRVPRSLRVLPASRHRRSRGSSVQPVVAPPRILRPRADLPQEPASDQPDEPSAGGALGEADRLRDHAREETLAAGEGLDDRPVRLVERRAAGPLGEDRDRKRVATWRARGRSGPRRGPRSGAGPRPRSGRPESRRPGNDARDLSRRGASRGHLPTLMIGHEPQGGYSAERQLKQRGRITRGFCKLPALDQVIKWWAETGLNRRHQDFQSCAGGFRRVRASTARV